MPHNLTRQFIGKSTDVSQTLKTVKCSGGPCPWMAGRLDPPTCLRLPMPYFSLRCEKDSSQGTYATGIMAQVHAP
jgi:hypothetical protein